MKVYLRDRITAGVGAGVLLVLVASSYYYSIRTEIEANQAFVDRDAPDFIAHNISVTEFKDDGSADRRLFAEYAEHYADGRMSSIKPRMVTLSADKPQVRATADSGQSVDGGETFTFNGNVLVTRAGDINNAPMRFTTPFATVYPDTSRLETSAPVVLEHGADITTGIGITLDNVDRTVNIHTNVKSIFAPRRSN